MTVQTNTNVASFNGNGVTQIFPIAFKFNNDTDLVVLLVDDDTGVSSLLTLNSDYTVSGEGDEEGGLINVVVAPAAGYRLKVSRIVDILQLLDLRNQGKFFAEVHEDAFDLLTMIAQQHESGIRSALRVADSDPEPGRLPSAASRANQVLSFDSFGNPVASAPASGSASDLAISLANAVDPLKGAGMIGFQGRFLAEYLGLAIRHVTPHMYGAAGDGVADDYAAITAAASEAASSGFELVLEGVYAISAGLDFSAVRKIRCRDRVTIKPLFDAGTAVTWAAASTQLIESPVQEGWLRVEWPTTDWTKERTSFVIQNIYNGRFFLESKGAARGVYVRGDERGCVYNDIHLGVMHQNCIGLWLGSASATGWCNANRFFGGRFYGSNPVAGALYEEQAGHIYIENAPYRPNGNEFNGPSLEWVGAGYRLARMGGLRNRLYPAYAELGDGDTTWVVDTGIENLIDCDGLPYLIGYDPDVAGSSNRVDVSTATRPVVRGNQGYHDAGGTGSMVRRVQSSSRAAIRGTNAGTGPGLEARNSASASNPGLVVTSPSGTRGVAIPAAGIWTVFNGVKKVHWSSSVAPTTGTWERGDLVFFTSPSAGGYVGAVCVEAGTPGTWKSFGAISA